MGAPGTVRKVGEVLLTTAWLFIHALRGLSSLSKGVFKAMKFSLNFQQVSANSTGMGSIWETFPKVSPKWFPIH